MGWFRLAGTFSDHPKVIAAGNAAVGLFVRLGCWSAEHETDGFVPEEVARRFGSRRELSRLLQSARPGSRPMLDVSDGGYLLRDFLAFNPSHDQQTARREATAKRQERWRDASRNASNNGPSSPPPFRSIPPVSLSLQSGDAVAASAGKEEETAWRALHLFADQLAMQYAAPDRRKAYARAVVARGADHLSSLVQIARESSAEDAEFVASLYAGRETARTHTSCLRCFGAGVIYVDETDPDRGMIPCPGDAS